MQGYADGRPKSVGRSEIFEKLGGEIRVRVTLVLGSRVELTINRGHEMITAVREFPKLKLRL